jgi:hypothetical protein
MSFNEHCLVVFIPHLYILYTAFVLTQALIFCFIYSILLIIQVRFKFFALWNRIPLFLNGQLVSSLSYPGLLVCKYMYHYDAIK